MKVFVLPVCLRFVFPKDTPDTVGKTQTAQTAHCTICIFRIYRQKKSDKSIWTFSSSPNVDKIFISTTWILCFVYAESE